MASKGERIDGSNRARVRTYLAANPGDHRPFEIANALGLTTHAVAVACYGLFEQGEAERGKRPAVNGRRPHNTYGITEKGAAAATVRATDKAAATG
jgi:predicted ArsR family transcriptional regulator